MVDPIWWTKMQKKTLLDFWGRSLRIQAQNLEIGNGGSNIANEKCKSYLVRMKFGTRGFFGSLITNPNSKVRHSKWWIQYG